MTLLRSGIGTEARARRWSRTGLLLVLLACLPSCQSTPPQPEVRHLLRHPTLGSRPTAAPRTSVLLSLDRLRIASHLRGITWERMNGTVDSLIYEVWAAPLDQMMAQWIREELIQSGTFPSVLSPEDSATGDWVLGLHALRFEIEELPAPPLHAVFVLEADLRTRADQRSAIWTRTFTARIPLAASSSGEVFVGGLRAALGQVARELASALEGLPPQS